MTHTLKRLLPGIFQDQVQITCASSLCEQGLDIKAIQEVLGHSWLSTTTHYIHVSSDHIERAWAAANGRVAARLTGEEG